MLDFRFQDNNSTCIIHSNCSTPPHAALYLSISLHDTTHVCVVSTCTLARVQYTRPRAGGDDYDGGTYYCVEMAHDISVAVRFIKVIRL